jgi:hypothetical protein
MNQLLGFVHETFAAEKPAGLPVGTEKAEGLCGALFGKMSTDR